MISRGWKILREEGLKSLIKSAHRFIGRKLTKLGIYRLPYHKRHRTDSLDRWNLIEPNLSENDNTALDIGCASGYFTNKLANNGLFSIGIDINRKRTNTSRKVWKDTENLGFMTYEINPQNIEKLPEFDVSLMLTVYHHWCKHYGREKSEYMLRELGKKSEKIFFEPPGKEDSRFELLGDSIGHKDIVQYYEDLLYNIFDGNINVKHLGAAEYPPKEERTDQIFLIECGEYKS